jgi:hypothetical protein
LNLKSGSIIGVVFGKRGHIKGGLLYKRAWFFYSFHDTIEFIPVWL